eukprot:GGOE01041305.1.p1 GENE.GGOE01041305.1~~GGOE01041305.1.p1  ORF type:complete len:426 (-),score=145.67 GGOE01041305.1:205-1386(-)
MEEGCSFLVGATNLTASILGISILSMPLVVFNAGYRLAPFIILLMGALGDVSLCLIVRAAQLTSETSFAGIGHKCFGSVGDAAVLVSLLSVLLGCCVTVLIVVAQLFRFTALTVLGADPNLSVMQPEVFSGLVLCAMFPFTLLPSLSMLAPTSMAAILFLVYVTVVVIGQWAQLGSLPGLPPIVISPSLCSVLPTCASAYICHFNVLPVYTELRASLRPHIFNLIHLVVLGIAVPVYILFGWAGFFQLGSRTAGCANVLLCFSNPYIQAGATAVGCTCFLKAPLLVLPFREALNEALFPGEQLRLPGIVMETASLFVVVYCIARCLGDVGRALSLLGATSGTFIMFVLPGLFYAQAQAHYGNDSTGSKLVGWGLALVGLLVMALGVYDALLGP